jgi:hypothetical protein
MAGELSADSYSNGVPAAGTFWDERRPMVRSVEVVEDLDATADEFRFRSASSVLDQLSTPNLATFRRAVRQRYREVNARYICGKCRKPVYVSLAGSGHPDGRDGRSALFAHHAGTANDCDWGTQSKDPREIDREKYKGIQEVFGGGARKRFVVFR